MSSQLATRCSACGTAFRVVQDQLKVSEGWVRCGRCETVFNALEQLFDVQRGSPSTAAGGDQPLVHESLPELPAPDAPKPPMADAFSALLRARSSVAGSERPAPPLGGRALPATQTPVSTTAEAAAAGWPDELRAAGGPAIETGAFSAGQPHRREQADMDLLLDVPGGEPHLLPQFDGAAAGIGAMTPAAAHFTDDDVRGDPLRDHTRHDTDTDTTTTTGTATPEFVRAAERDARWRRPPVRWALTAASAVLLLALALQAAHQFRDGLAARWPQGQPLLDGWCAFAGCTIEPPRRIADVTVENTGLAPAGSAAGLFQLSVTLRNRGRLAVALPAVDLSLTDSNGQLVSRRALLPNELSAVAAAGPGGAATATPATSYGAASSAAGSRAASPRIEVLRPDSDTRLQALLATDGRVVGYTVELFYP